MARYINADVLIEKIIKKATEMFTVDSVYQHYLNALIDVEDIIKAESTADVVDRKKGKWKREVLGSTSGYGTTVMYQCSNCEHMAISQYNFCSNCGADMRKEVEQ